MSRYGRMDRPREPMAGPIRRHLARPGSDRIAHGVERAPLVMSRVRARPAPRAGWPCGVIAPGALEAAAYAAPDRRRNGVVA